LRQETAQPPPPPPEAEALPPIPQAARRRPELAAVRAPPLNFPSARTSQGKALPGTSLQRNNSALRARFCVAAETRPTTARGVGKASTSASPHLRRVTLAVMKHEVPYPLHINLPGPYTVVLQANPLAHAIQQFRGLRHARHLKAY